MLILANWLSLLLYSVSWIASLVFQNSLKPHWLDLMCLRAAWLIHTAILLITLYTISDWPSTFVGDLLSAVAWISLVISQAFPGRWTSNTHSSILRVFSVLLLGLSISLSQEQFTALKLIYDETWLRQALLGFHIISLTAGYVLFGAACVASILFLYQEHQLKAKLTRQMKRRFPALGTLDRINIRTLQWGFVGLTLGLILGMMLAEGPRSNWSAIRLGLSMGVWCIYAVLILLRELKPAPNRWYLIWPIIGFCFFLAALVTEWYQLT